MTVMEESKDMPIESINLGDWINGEQHQEAIAAKWDLVFRSTGLVYLTNHGLGPLYHRVAEEWRIFCALPSSEKEKFSSSVYGACGYNSIGKEAVALSEDKAKTSNNSIVVDPVESLENGYSDAFDGAFPRQANGYVGGNKLRDACVELYRTLDKKVIRPCLAIATMALSLNRENLENRWFAEGPGAYHLRLARYSPGNEENVDEKNEKEVLYGEHTDYDGLTFLWRNQTNGLQALIGHTWHDIPVLGDEPDALVINLGDLMQFWTQGIWHSPSHRVLRTRSKPSSKDLSDLVSIVFFSGPHEATKLLPLPSPKLPSFNECSGEIITAGEHVQNKIAKTAQ